MMDDRVGVELVFDDGLVVIRVNGELDMASAPHLSATLALVDADRRVVVEMAGVHFMDSTGLNVILTHYARMREAGGSLRIRRPSAPVRCLLHLTSFEQLVEVDAPAEA